jgi:methionyl-tRNA formyltransferase
LIAPVAPDRLVVFADPRILFAPPLADAALAAAWRIPGLRPVALVDAAETPLPPAPLRIFRRLVGVAVERLFASAASQHDRSWLPPPSLARIAQRRGVPLVVPSGRDVNAPDLRDRLGRGEEPVLALSVGCLQRFRRPLLDLCAVAANFHDGQLPAYRGLRATGWSIYRGERESGFSFHRMTERLDDGPILAAGKVPVPAGATALALLRAKTGAAAGQVDAVLRAMRERTPGRAQRGPASYFGRREAESVRRIDDPAAVDWDDLDLRLRAFGGVELALAGRTWEVTAVRRLSRPSRRRLAFTTRDGIAAEPVRFLHLPAPLYRLRCTFVRGGELDAERR